MTEIHLLWITGDGAPAPVWPLGGLSTTTPSVAALNAALAELPETAGFVLFWDAALGAPDPSRIHEAAAVPGDVWHAGLRLGMGGLPSLIDFVDPVWRFNRDPDPTIVATSWRLTWRACLVRRGVLEQLGGLCPGFESLDAAALEMGHRWIINGAAMRHVPDFVGPNAPVPASTPALPLADEFRFILSRYGRMWAGWALWRCARNGVPAGAALSALRAARTEPLVAAGRRYRRPELDATPSPVAEPAVSILIPTLDRYPTLFALLEQLRQQTTPPLEIVVVDQTGPDERRPDWPERYPDLPLRVIWRDTAGQCSSRNAGLAALAGDAVLFLDDDDEVSPDLIGRHLAYLMARGADASCGVAEELGAGALPYHFTYERDSDVFPTNNTLLRIDALRGSGLFDLAYERGERADGDLGMRLYLSGALLGLNPAASVVHLHAPRGGLRQHNARVVTYGGSRASLRQRHLLAPTEGYLWSRYFSPRQVHEALLIRTAGTLRGPQSGLRRLARAAWMAFMLPSTWRENSARLSSGAALFKDYPQIPALQRESGERILWPKGQYPQ